MEIPAYRCLWQSSPPLQRWWLRRPWARQCRTRQRISTFVAARCGLSQASYRFEEVSGPVFVNGKASALLVDGLPQWSCLRSVSCGCHRQSRSTSKSQARFSRVRSRETHDGSAQSAGQRPTAKEFVHGVLKEEHRKEKWRWMRRGWMELGGDGACGPLSSRFRWRGAKKRLAFVCKLGQGGCIAEHAHNNRILDTIGKSLTLAIPDQSLSSGKSSVSRIRVRRVR